MATFDQLPAEQRAIIELVLRSGQSYEDLSGMLGMPPARVRDRAREALAELAPVTAARVDDEWRGQIADYVLGQQSGPESTATRGHLKRSEAARMWALSLLDSLDPLYPDGARPIIPQAEAEPAKSRARERTLRTRERPARRPAREGAAARPRERPPRRDAPLSPAATSVVWRRRIIGALAAAAALGLLGVVLLGGDGDEKTPTPRADRPARGGDVRIVGQTLLRPVGGGADGAGVAVVVDAGRERQLIVQARLRPTTRRQAYQVWLYNSRRDLKSLGAQVAPEGNYQGRGPLPDDYERYEFIDVSRESIDRDAEHSGTSVLRGRLADALAGGAQGAAEGEAGQGDEEGTAP